MYMQFKNKCLRLSYLFSDILNVFGFNKFDINSSIK